MVDKLVLASEGVLLLLYLLNYLFNLIFWKRLDKETEEKDVFCLGK